MNKKITGGLLVFLGACSFGLLSTVVKFAYDRGYTLGEIAGTQSFIGMILLWLAYAFFDRRKKQGAKPASTAAALTTVWKVCLAGAFSGLVGIFYYQCVKLLPASIAIIVLMQYLWVSVLIEAVVFKKKPTRMQVFTLLLVWGGTLLAGGFFSDAIAVNIKGIVYGMLAAISYAIFIIASGRIGNDLPDFKKSAWMITGSCLITFALFPPFYFFNGVFWGELCLWGLVLALLGTVVPPYFFSVGMPRVGVSAGAILSAAELPVATLSSALILKEFVDAVRWAGVAVILLAIVAANLRLGDSPAASTQKR